MAISTFKTPDLWNKISSKHMDKGRKETKNVNAKFVIMFFTIQHCHYLEDHECALLYFHMTVLAFSLTLADGSYL